MGIQADADLINPGDALARNENLCSLETTIRRAFAPMIEDKETCDAVEDTVKEFEDKVKHAFEEEH